MTPANNCHSACAMRVNASRCETEFNREIQNYVYGNGRNDHVIMFTLHLSLLDFNFLVKFSSFVLALKVRIILHYSNSHT